MHSSTIHLTLCDFGNKTDYVLDHPQKCVVGRADDCDIHLPADESHRDVSRHHCEIEADPPSIRVRDLGSTNGTFVNGALIGSGRVAGGLGPGSPLPAHALGDGDEIGVGSVVLRVHFSSEAEAEDDEERALVFPQIA